MQVLPKGIRHIPGYLDRARQEPVQHIDRLHHCLASTHGPFTTAPRRELARCGSARFIPLEPAFVYQLIRHCDRAGSGPFRGGQTMPRTGNGSPWRPMQVELRGSRAAEATLEETPAQQTLHPPSLRTSEMCFAITSRRFCGATPAGP